MIQVRGWHGKLTPEFAKRMDAIAKPSAVTPDLIWMFDGTMGEFAEQWQGHFMALWDDEKSCYDLFITQFRSFSTR